MRDLRNSEVGEPQYTIWKQQQIVWLHVAMNHMVLVRERNRTQQLLAEIKRGPYRQPASQPLFERLFAKGQGDYQMAIDEVSTLEPQDIRMIQLCREPHLTRKV